MPDEGRPRLIEVAFPLKQASLDSVHEKNVRHGHISTLHIWPARRPLAASRAALIATLLPDPGNDEDRKRLLERLGGKVVTKNTVKREGGREIHVIKEETEGGILHWGRESGPDLDFFRQEIRKAYGGRAPRVLDPFAGGGAIPLEAMRLGCEVTAVDINPVAWFILKCTLEYPQKLAGQKQPLPRFALKSPEFMAEYAKSTGVGKKKGRKKGAPQQPSMLETPEADLAWHVRAWGHWVLERARADLERFYPTIDGKPTVAYLWARTVTCKNCRATLPLLKTLWLCRKDNKRWRLAMKPRPDRSGVDFEVVAEAKASGSAAQQREHDRRAGQGTMSRSGAWCPVCGGPNTVAMTLDDIRAEGKKESHSTPPMTGLGAQMTAAVVDGPTGKEYRLPMPEELQAAEAAEQYVEKVFAGVPFGLPTEPTPAGGGSGAGRAFSVQNYGFDQWYKLFTPRQLVALGTFVIHNRAARDAMRAEGYANDWAEAVDAYLACALSKLLDYGNSLCSWYTQNEQITHLFNRFALPAKWDFAETSPIAGASGSWESMLNSVSKSVATAVALPPALLAPNLAVQSAVSAQWSSIDLVVTDPPYYDAIPYSDAMDFFHVWLRRSLHDFGRDFDEGFDQPLGPKWSPEESDGELVDDASRFGGDEAKSRLAYEGGMFRALEACRKALTPYGRMVVVFANKEPAAWEALVAAVIRAGYVVDGSWPIQTEMSNRARAHSSAALASSVWLVCKKRSETARPGWDNQVLEEMRSRIYDRLRQFWDAGIRGPDFVWAATGPALEAYSKHPVVKKADAPDSVLTVSEFLGQVRRIVVDYVVGRVLSRDGESDEAAELDNQTIYYLLHRHDFGFTEAPAGACILYAQSCGLRDRDLADRYNLIKFTKGKSRDEDEAEEDDDAEDADGDEGGGSGSKVVLKRWDQRRRNSLGVGSEGRPSPLIDQAHHVMHLWGEGDQRKVDDYFEEQGLRRNPLFPRLLQALVELARKDNQQEERALLETIMNHVTARGAHPQMRLGSQ
jgi:putative DNA methylase